MSASSPRPIVLLVEDNPDALDGMAVIFEEEGFSVLTAKSVNEAVNLLSDGHVPTLVLSDLVMPHISGWELLKYLREDADLRHVPVIVVTAVDTHDVRVIADVVIQKPIDPQKLIETARRLVGTHI